VATFRIDTGLGLAGSLRRTPTSPFGANLDNGAGRGAVAGEALGAQMRPSPRSSLGPSTVPRTSIGVSRRRTAPAIPLARTPEYGIEHGRQCRSGAPHLGSCLPLTTSVRVVDTVGDRGLTLDTLANEHGFATGRLGVLFVDHDRAPTRSTYTAPCFAEPARTRCSLRRSDRERRCLVTAVYEPVPHWSSSRVARN
jgi:hypothetical protein